MMKRLCLTLFALLAGLSAWADYTAYVTCNDGSVQAYDIAAVTDITFSADGSYLYLHANDGVTATYPVSYLTSIEFEQPSGSTPVVYATDFDVTFDASDDTSYDSVTETVPTKETSPGYGDFVENYEDDEESKGTVTITYNDNTASITYNPTNLKNKAVMAMSGTSSDVVLYATKKVDYVLKGSSTNGSLTVYGAKKCKMTLNNLSLKNADGPAIMMPDTILGTTEYGGKTAFVVLSGTNTIEDGNYVPVRKTKATFFSKGQLIFSGTGTLNVKANSGHGIASNDYIRLRGGNNNPIINITTSNEKDGISVNDYFLMYGGELTINAADDGISVNKGYVDIAGGKLTINSVDEGIVTGNEENDPAVVPDITIRGGLVKVTTTGDKGMAFKTIKDFTQKGGIVQATVKGQGSKAFNADGNMSLTGGKATLLAEGLPIYDEEDSDLSSAAGIRCRGTLTIDGISLAMKASAQGGKGINTAGLLTVKSGQVTVVTTGTKYSTGGKTCRARGITADSGLTVSGGSVCVSSVDDALYTPQTFSFSGGAFHAFSEGHAVSAAATQHSAGWLVTR